MLKYEMTVWRKIVLFALGSKLAWFFIKNGLIDHNTSHYISLSIICIILFINICRVEWAVQDLTNE